MKIGNRIDNIFNEIESNVKNMNEAKSLQIFDKFLLKRASHCDTYQPLLHTMPFPKDGGHHLLHLTVMSYTLELIDPLKIGTCEKEEGTLNDVSCLVCDEFRYLPSIDKIVLLDSRCGNLDVFNYVNVDADKVLLECIDHVWMSASEKCVCVEDMVVVLSGDGYDKVDVKKWDRNHKKFLSLGRLPSPSVMSGWIDLATFNELERYMYCYYSHGKTTTIDRNDVVSLPSNHTHGLISVVIDKTIHVIFIPQCLKHI